MSINESCAALYSDLTPEKRIVLFFMGECCGDHGDCHVRQEFLVFHAGAKASRLKAILVELEDDGFITDRGPSDRYEGDRAYWIHIEKLDARKKDWPRFKMEFGL